MARMIYSAPTREEAIERAAQELAVPAEALEAEILEDASSEDKSADEDGVCLRVRVSVSYAAEQAVEILGGLLTAMGAGGEVEAKTSGNTINLTVEAANSSLLIGRDGHTLDAIQHWLTRAIAKITCASPRLLVDVENYRQRKFDKLRDMARRAGKRVAQNGRTERLTAMGPVERKFIHNSLKDIDGIMTYSVGREGHRSVVVALKDDEEAIRQRDAEERDYEHEEETEQEREPRRKEERRPRQDRQRPREAVQDDSEDEIIDHEALPADELLSSRSTYSSLKVVATPDNLDTGDNEIDDELGSSLYSHRDILRKRVTNDDEIEDELH